MATAAGSVKSARLATIGSFPLTRPSAAPACAPAYPNGA
jgi:hypothetical protein